MTMQLAARRQARFVLGRVILPPGLVADRWYDVSQGRRRDDQRPGTVLLDLGTHRIHAPTACLGFRSDADADAPAPNGKPPRRWSRKLALAVTLPIGLVAVAAVSFLAVETR